MISQAELILRVITLVLGLISFFRDGMGPFKLATGPSTNCDSNFDSWAAKSGWLNPTPSLENN